MDAVNWDYLFISDICPSVHLTYVPPNPTRILVFQLKSTLFKKCISNGNDVIVKINPFYLKADWIKFILICMTPLLALGMSDPKKSVFFVFQMVLIFTSFNIYWSGLILIKGGVFCVTFSILKGNVRSIWSTVPLLCR